MRDLWVLLLFLGGVVIGGAAGAVYHQVKAKSLVQTIEVRDSEIAEFKQRLKREQASAAESKAEAAEEFDKLQREYDGLQVQLAEQKRLAALQRDQIAKFVAANDSEDIAPAPDPELEPTMKEDGRVSGGKFRYHHVKIRPHDEGIEIAGELENRTEKSFGTADFKLEVFDENHQMLDLTTITINAFVPGQTRQFKAYALMDQPASQNAVHSFRITVGPFVEKPK